MNRLACPTRAICAAMLLILVALPQAALAQWFCRYTRPQTAGLLIDWTKAAAHAKYCGFPAEAVRDDGIEAFVIECTRFWTPNERMDELLSFRRDSVRFKILEQIVSDRPPSKLACDKALKDLRFYDKTMRAEVARLRRQEEAASRRAEKNRIPDRILPPD